MSFTTAVVSRAGQVADQLDQMHKADKSALYGTPMSMAIYFCTLEALACIAIAYHATMTAVKIIPATVRLLIGWIPGCREVAEMIPGWLSMQTLIWTHLSGMAFSVVIAVMAPITTARDRASHKAESMRSAAKLLFTANIPIAPPKPIGKVRQLMRIILSIPAVIAVSNPHFAIYLLDAFFRRFKDGPEYRPGGGFGFGGQRYWERRFHESDTAKAPKFQITEFNELEKCKFAQDKEKFDKLVKSCIALDERNPPSIWAVLGEAPRDCQHVKHICRHRMKEFHPDKLNQDPQCSNITNPASFRCIQEACEMAATVFDCPPKNM